ncbi:MAG: hypothetical protein JST93_20290 [Acidobacteria bacterium]|jgi:hypothetical protein|nr:hypothetical protein [Acidobacteriota bacterium]
MRRFATLWAIAGSFLMLCLLSGAAEWGKDSGKALRSQRSRSTRATRLDADHEAYDHSGDLLNGSYASSLSRQANPSPPPPRTVTTAQWLPDFRAWEPVRSFLPLPYRSFLRSTSSGRSPPAFLL